MLFADVLAVCLGASDCKLYSSTAVTFGASDCKLILRYLNCDWLFIATPK